MVIWLDHRIVMSDDDFAVTGDRGPVIRLPNYHCLVEMANQGSNRNAMWPVDLINPLADDL